MASMGSIQAAICYASVLTIFAPVLNMTFIPFSIPNLEVAWKVLDSPYGHSLMKNMEKKTGLRLMEMTCDGGFRTFTSKFLMRKPADAKGRKIRIPESKALTEMIKSMGGIPVVVPWPETYTSLQTGLAEAQESPTPGAAEIKLWEIQKYLILTDHVYHAHGFFINNAWFEKLTKDQQEVVKKASRFLKITNYGINMKIITEAVDLFRKNGTEVIVLTPEEKEAFRKVTQKPVADWCKKEYGEATVNEYFSQIEKAKAALGMK